MKQKIVLGIVFLMIISTVNAATWVNNPVNCPDSYLGQECAGAGEVMCGLDGDILQCYASASLNAPISAATSTTSYSGSLGGGYILDCEYYDGTSPHCDNGGSFWCNRDNSCFNVNRQTACTASTWGAFSCGNCISGYTYCDGSFVDGDGCEVNIGVTPYPGESNAHYDAACNPECNTGYLDCNGDLGSSGNGCEILNGGACTTSGLPGTYQGCSGGTGNCVAGKQLFETGTNAQYATTDPLLWGTQHGAGVLMHLANQAGDTFEIDNSGCIIFPDFSQQCTAGIGGPVDDGDWTMVGNDVYRNIGNVGIGTTTPEWKFAVDSGTGAQTVARIGSDNPLYFMQGAPQIDFNLYSDGTDTYFGKGSLGEYGGILHFSAWNGKFGIFTTDSGNEDEIATTTERFSILSDGRVGIGTTSPAEALDVVGNIVASGTICDGTGCIGSGADTDWTEASGNIYRLNGNVGIGTTTPSTELDVNGDIQASNVAVPTAGLIKFEGTGGDTQISYPGVQLNVMVDGGNRLTISNSVAAFTTPLIVQQNFDVDTGDATFHVDSTSNRVGIGTTTPTEALDVAGNIEATGDICTTTACLNSLAGTGISYRGYTTSTYSGQISATNGYDAAHAICDSEFTGSHMCTQAEILTLIALTDTSSITGNVWIQKGAPGFTADANDCVGWTSNSNQKLGAYWRWDNDYGVMINCQTQLPLSCCGGA